MNCRKSPAVFFNQYLMPGISISEKGIKESLKTALKPFEFC